MKSEPQFAASSKAGNESLFHDLRCAATNLAMVLDIIQRSARVTDQPIYGDGLPSPRLALLLLADVPMHLAHFYLALAQEQAYA